MPVGGGINSPIWSVVSENFAEVSGMPIGVLPANIFLVGQGGPGRPRDEDHNIYAAVEGTNKSIRFHLVDDPVIEREQLILSLSAPDTTWMAARDFGLELLVPVGKVIQSLGIWPLAGLEGQCQTFKCNLSGVVNGTIECGSVIHARLHR